MANNSPWEILQSEREFIEAQRQAPRDPEVQARYLAHLASRDPGRAEIFQLHNRLLNEQPDDAVRTEAARDWCAWEAAVVSLDDDWTPHPRYADPAFRMTCARLCAHYCANAAWLDENELLANAHRLAGIPGVLIHGRLEISSPKLSCPRAARCKIAWRIAGSGFERTQEMPSRATWR